MPPPDPLYPLAKDEAFPATLAYPTLPPLVATAAAFPVALLLDTGPIDYPIPAPAPAAAALP